MTTLTSESLRLFVSLIGTDIIVVVVVVVSWSSLRCSFADCLTTGYYCTVNCVSLRHVTVPLRAGYYERRGEGASISRRS